MKKMNFKITTKYQSPKGRIGYFVLWLMGAPVGLLLLLWVIFGNNLIGQG